MTSILDFKKQDGSTDWSGYDRARIANGEECYQCGAVAMIFGTGRRELCHDCKRMVEDAGQVQHEEMIRCPKCGRSWKPDHFDQYEVFGDGEHDITCVEDACGHQFEISTRLHATFHSPPRIKEDHDGKDKSDEEESDEVDHGGGVEQDLPGGDAGAGDHDPGAAPGGARHAE